MRRIKSKDILECCQATLAFINDKREYHDCETIKEMDRVLAKNGFFGSERGTNMSEFMRWLSREWGFDSPDNYEDLRAYFSDGHTYPEAPAKLLLRSVIRDIKLEEIC